MNNFLKYVPGFRSGVTWKKIVATIYYLFCLLTLTAGLGAFLFFTAIPFIVFSLTDLIQRNKKGISFKKAVIPLTISLAIAIVGLATFPSTENNNGITKEVPQIVQENPTAEYSTTITETEAKQEESQTIEQKNDAPEKTEASANPQESLQPVGQNSNASEASQEKPENNDNGQKDIPVTPADKELKVHFIDVGQGDSIFIHTNNAAMLIDAGSNGDGSKIVSYIRQQGFNKLDYVIFTHPHADHIGGAVDVVNSFEIGKIIMPKVEHTTQTYENLLLAIKSKGLKITFPNPGDEYSLSSAKFKILAPNSLSYKDLNDYSVVTRLTFGETSFLFTGDAESVSENEILSKGFDIKSDVLKVGHHGSSSSTTQAFLNKVNPKYAIIMVGADNNYGHPHKETMDKLKAKGIPVYRTDENGTIVATSDGSNITFNTQPGSYTSRESGSTSSSSVGTTSSNSSSKTTTSGSEKTSSESSTTVVTPSTPNKNNADRIVYWTPKGKSYHFSKDCPTLSRSKTILSGPLSECPKSDPCDRCTY
ncbi:hypothetical protein CTHBC1_2631 [Acetivibrio thermocellus BC1]|nr:hypothetical protein CTHBC1_2631 [Acetivibrio thermocellus BC1]